jgi:ubiquitin-protein ligase
MRILDENPLYKDETYRLRFKFGENYPIRTSSLNTRDASIPSVESKGQRVSAELTFQQKHQK